MPPKRSKHQEVPGHLYRPGHPLGQRLIKEAGSRDVPPAEVSFAYSDRPGRLSAIESFIGSSGWLTVGRLSIEMDAGAEDHLLLAGYADDGRSLDAEQIEALFRIPGATSRIVMLDSETQRHLAELIQQRRAETLESLENRVNAWLDQEQAKLDAWAEDRRLNLVGDIDQLDRQISRLKREMRTNPGDLRNRRHKQLEINDLTRKRDDLEDRNRQRRREIEREQETLLDRAYERINQSSEQTDLFTIRWRLNP